jgi:hypothetical protein
VTMLSNERQEKPYTILCPTLFGRPSLSVSFVSQSACAAYCAIYFYFMLCVSLIAGNFRNLFDSVLSILGGGLIVLSVVAFRNIHSTEQELDRVFSASLKAIESGAAVATLSKILSVPVQLLAACKNAIVSAVSFPFRLVHLSVVGIGQAGSATGHVIGDVIQWIIGLPGNAALSFVTFISNRSRRTAEALSASAVAVFVRSLASSYSNSIMAIHTALASIGLALSRGVSSLDSLSKSLVSTCGEVVSRMNARMMSTRNKILSVGATSVYGISYSSFTLRLYGEELVDFFNRILSRLSRSSGTRAKRL